MIIGKRYRFKDGTLFPFGFLTAVFDSRSGAGWPCFKMGDGKLCAVNAVDETFELVESEGEDCFVPRTEVAEKAVSKFYADIIYRTLEILQAPTPRQQPVTNLIDFAERVVKQRDSLLETIQTVRKTVS